MPILPSRSSVPTDPKAQRSLFLKAGWVFLGLGIISFVLTCVFVYPTISLWTKGVKTTGTITGFTQTGNIRNPSVYDDVQFQDSDGASHTVLIQPITSYTVGEKMPLYYDSSNPENAVSANQFALIAEMIFFAIFSLALITGGIFSFRQAGKVPAAQV